ncbi:hexapeptide transferase [Pedobacter psychrophilus]|uniref:Hexapeptide transferase n=1 Tax=Pedobacter psychrophilus TaxID=1826909 RepID=A0A179DDN9_9SPHI|nr:acyltransferase [Pedobacter psychrophilus]OAQ38810.1 hexapeptide transferase [Pedobacter psychrophilus]
MPKTDIFVHPTSIIDENVTIGNGTKIWHFCHVSEDVTIGENCSFGQNVFIGKNVKIGNGVKIQNNVSVFEGVEIEDDVFIGPSVVFTNILNPRAFINRKMEFKKTVIEKGASIGANATIICGNKIGKYALIGAGSVITKTVRDFELCYGNPAIKKGIVDKEGNINLK